MPGAQTARKNSGLRPLISPNTAVTASGANRNRQNTPQAIPKVIRTNGTSAATGTASTFCAAGARVMTTSSRLTVRHCPGGAARRPLVLRARTPGSICSRLRRIDHRETQYDADTRPLLQHVRPRRDDGESGGRRGRRRRGNRGHAEARAGTRAREGTGGVRRQDRPGRAGGLWANGKLVGKAGSVFTSTASQHGGQETTITSFHNTLIHHGMVVVGVPYTCQALATMDEVMGGSAYGAATLADTDGSRTPSEKELTIARFQGQHVAEIAKKLIA